jgi:predicted dienelactone hydrolase
LGVLSLLAGLAVLFALRNGGQATAGGTGDAVPVVSDLSSSSFVNPGPFGVGVTTLSLPSNGAPVEVWYPANPNYYHGDIQSYQVSTYLPAALKQLFRNVKGATYPVGGIPDVTMASGRFPVVVFSHGFAGYNAQSSFLTSHLASWGFVVAAPEHLSRDLAAVLDQFLRVNPPKGSDVTDLENTITLMGDQNSSSSSIFNNHLDMSRVGAVGHSAGGAAVEKLAVADNRVDVFVGLAGATVGAFGQSSTGAGSTVPKVPGLLESGTSDKIVPTASIIRAYNALNQPKRLVTLLNAGHLVFADICQIDPGQGGLVGLGKKVGLSLPAQLVTLGSDGCLSPDVSPPTAWPAIYQSVTAEIRWVMGFDGSQAGLENLGKTFPGIVGINTTASNAS